MKKDIKDSEKVEPRPKDQVRIVNVTIEKKGDEITVTNSLGKKWYFPTNDSAGMVCAMVANSCYEFFRHFDEVDECFTMSLTVSNDEE